MTAVPKFIWGLSGKTYTDPAEYDVGTLLAPCTTIVALPTNGAAFNPPKKFIGNAAGVATVVDASGNTITGFPITGGEQNVTITAISALETTTAVWGLY